MRFCKRFYITLLAIIFSLSCRANKDVNYMYLIDRVLNSENEVVKSFTYDSNNRLIEYTSYFPDKESKNIAYTKYTFTYNEQGKVSKYSFKFLLTPDAPQDTKVINNTVTYADAKTIQVSYIENGVLQVDIYELDDKNRVVKYTTGEAESTILTYDSNSNVTAMNSENGYKVVYSYGDKNSIYKDLTLPQWLSLTVLGLPVSPNNIISMQVYDDADGTSSEDGYTSEYVCDESNYPISMNYSYVNATPEVYTIEYKIVEKK